MVLNEFAVQGDDSPKVIEAFGVTALRLPMLPGEVPGEQRDAVMIAGRAQYFSAARLLPAARQAFEQLVARYPDLSNAHYAFGVFLLGEEPDRGVEELKKELKVTPGHSLAMLSLAFEYFKRSDFASAKDWATQAVTADPGNYMAHKALGQTLLDMGDTDGAIKELEAGVNIAPTSPTVRFQLAKAYQKAGRSADAERERAEFSRLDRQLRAARAGAQSVGGAERFPRRQPSPLPISRINQSPDEAHPPDQSSRHHPDVRRRVHRRGPCTTAGAGACSRDRGFARPVSARSSWMSSCETTKAIPSVT